MPSRPPRDPSLARRTEPIHRTPGRTPQVVPMQEPPEPSALQLADLTWGSMLSEAGKPAGYLAAADQIEDVYRRRVERDVAVPHLLFLQVKATDAQTAVLRQIAGSLRRIEAGLEAVRRDGKIFSAELLTELGDLRGPLLPEESDEEPDEGEADAPDGEEEGGEEEEEDDDQGPRDGNGNRVLLVDAERT